MNSIPCPVVVARWFPGGAGYAYGEGVGENLLHAVISRLAPIVQRNEECDFEEPLDGGQVLLGRRSGDGKPLDPDVTDRHPYIIRAAVCGPEFGTWQRREVRRQLLELPVPEKPDLHPNLAVRVYPPSPPPVVPSERGHLSGLWVWALAGLMVASDIGLHLAHLGDGVAGVVFRVSLWVVVLLAWTRLRRRPPLAADIAAIEREWFADVEPPDGGVRIKDDGVVITPDGLVSRPPGGAGLQSLGMPRLPRSEVVYRLVRPTARSILLIGEEVVVLGGPAIRVSFTRTYAFDGGRWWLEFAQWTTLREHSDRRPVGGTEREPAGRSPQPTSGVVPGGIASDQRGGP